MNSKLLHEFISKFTNETIINSQEIIEINKKFFLVDSQKKEIIKKIEEKSDLEPFSAGIFLGDAKKKEFKPSLALLDMIAKHSDRKVFIDEKGEEQFLYGKNLFGKSIVHAESRKGFVLIQNKKDENLGYGSVVGALNPETSRVVIRNILDRGDFIRREIKKPVSSNN